MSVKQGIRLGPTLDHLLNEKIPLRARAGEHQRGFGIQYPLFSVKSGGFVDIENRGTGNIVVAGRPGAGKSTFGLQVAATAATQGHSSIYVSLEDPLADIQGKADMFGWSEWTTRREKPFCLPESPSPVDLAVGLSDCLSKPQVLLTTLSQRPLVTQSTDVNALFWERYIQIEHLLKASTALLRGTNPMAPRLIVVDSLNMLISGNPGPSELGLGNTAEREALYRIFEIVRRSGLVGVFLVEANVAMKFDSTMADVVIALRSEKVQGYFMRHIEVEKSRYTKHTLGEHPYKIVSIETGDSGHQVENDDRPRGIVAFPSVHAVIKDTKKGVCAESASSFDMVSPVITDGLIRSNLPRGGSLTIVGPSGTFKSTLALNFLAGGLCRRDRFGKDDENVLYVRLGNHFGEVESIQNMLKLRELDEHRKFKLVSNPDGRFAPPGAARKASVSVLRRTQQPTSAELIVLDFETGALLPEEFVEIVRRVFDIAGSIRRVVLDDLSLIGVSYPFLNHSKTTEDLFLSTFVHLIKNLGADLVMVGTTGELAETQDVVNRATALADAVLSCRFQEIFGQRHVVLSGDGLGTKSTEDKRIDGEFVPAVLRRVDEERIEIDNNLLQGLVGFETGNIQRPGITMYLYSENRLQERYSKEIQDLLRTIVPVSSEGPSVVPFDARQSETFHHSLAVLRHEPRDRTIIYTVDEFKRQSPDHEHVEPFCKNVLLLAYRSNSADTQEHRFRSWAQVETFARALMANNNSSITTPFWFDRNASETLSCVLMDALWKAGGSRKKKFDAAILRQLPERRSVMPQLNALHNLFHLSEESKEFRELRKAGANGQNAPSVGSQLVKDAGVYLCWYSQLRELIDREPWLAGRLKVAPLPGRGFRGDWYLTVLPSSVSINLGRKLIETLTKPEEDYKRFARGVGLPTSDRKDLESAQFLAWPQSTVPLKRILDIHDNAHSRSDIPNYELFRNALQTICTWLTPMAGDRLSKSQIWRNVSRLPSQLSLLAPEGEL